MSEQREQEAAPSIAPEVVPAVNAEPTEPIAATEPVTDPAPAETAEAAPKAATEVAALSEELLSGATEKPAEPAAIEPAVAPPAEEAAPAYDWQPFTLPEGAPALDEERLTNLRNIITAPDLSPQERAQQLLDLHVAEMRAYDEATLERQRQVFSETQNGWRDQFRGDPEIGGAAAQTTLQRANAAIRRFLSNDRRLGETLPPRTPEEIRTAPVDPRSDLGKFMDTLRVTGAINHPEMVRYLARVENMLREPAMAAPAIGPSAVPRDIGNRRPSTQAGNPGRGARQMRELYDNPRSQEVFNGGGR